MLTLLLALSVARADDAALRTCCAAAGVDCPATVAIVGPGSSADATGITGLWVLTCDTGASFFPHAHADDASLQPGDVATALAPDALACVTRACALPEELCLQRDVDGTPRAVRCGGVAAADTRTLTAAPRATDGAGSPDTRVAVAPAAPLPPVAPPVAPPPPRVAPTVAGTPARATDAVLDVRPRETPPASAAAPPAKGPVDPALWTVPPAPPEPCVASGELRTASAEQVSMGDEARVAGDVTTALGHYRAALQVDACNAFGWTGLGTTLSEQGYAARGVEALLVATHLAPRHIPAWVALARADEALGRSSAAIDAWQQAATLRPGYPPAEDALSRLGRRP